MPSATNLQTLCQKYGVRFKKQLGQNLLLDDNINRIMVEAAALSAGDDVVEVGAGLGALTERLRHAAHRVFAVEIDASFMPCLEDRFADADNVVLFRGDILNHRLAKLLDEYLSGARTLKMVSNLPYYITSPILFHFWETERRFERLVVMVQEEVARRLDAPPASNDYSAISIAAQTYAEVDIVHRVPRTCFRPRPKVDSCIVRLRTRQAPRFPGVDVRFMMRIVRTAFGQRRKTLRNSLANSGALEMPRDSILDAMVSAGINPVNRPQTVPVEQFAHLARELAARRK